mmetsp:Transcript_5489/g.33900  ORF Transcript_5489/g.33900 Transcript_5489/m.33900 type:complete len:242 (+) Transcript_5489:2336-3061(+)
MRGSCLLAQYRWDRSCNVAFLFSNFLPSCSVSGKVRKWASRRDVRISTLLQKNSTMPCLSLMSSVSKRGCFSHTLSSLFPIADRALFIIPYKLQVESLSALVGKTWRDRIAAASNLMKRPVLCNCSVYLPRSAGLLRISEKCSSPAKAAAAHWQSITSLWCSTEPDLRSFDKSWSKSLVEKWLLFDSEQSTPQRAYKSRRVLPSSASFNCGITISRTPTWTTRASSPQNWQSSRNSHASIR